MNEPFDPLTNCFTDVHLPNLKECASEQAEQIAANDRLENAIESCVCIWSRSSRICRAQLTACGELAGRAGGFNAGACERHALAPDRTTPSTDPLRLSIDRSRKSAER